MTGVEGIHTQCTCSTYNNCGISPLLWPKDAKHVRYLFYFPLWVFTARHFDLALLSVPLPLESQLNQWSRLGSRRSLSGLGLHRVQAPLSIIDGDTTWWVVHISFDKDKGILRVEIKLISSIVASKFSYSLTKTFLFRAEIQGNGKS